MIKLIQIDYDREMAFIAQGPDDSGEIRTLGVVRAVSRPDNSEAEFAVTVRSDLKRLGLGVLLMDKIIRYLKERGTGVLSGQAMGENTGMAELARSLGFEVTKNYEDDLYDFHMPLK